MRTYTLPVKSDQTLTFLVPFSLIYLSSSTRLASQKSQQWPDVMKGSCEVPVGNSLPQGQVWARPGQGLQLPTTDGILKYREAIWMQANIYNSTYFLCISYQSNAIKLIKWLEIPMHVFIFRWWNAPLLFRGLNSWNRLKQSIYLYLVFWQNLFIYSISGEKPNF